MAFQWHSLILLWFAFQAGSQIVDLCGARASADEQSIEHTALLQVDWAIHGADVMMLERKEKNGSAELGMPGLNVLHVTMTFPSDPMALDLMVEHQRRQLSRGHALIKTVVLDNKPPWLENATSPHDGELKKLQDTVENLVAVPLNFSAIDDINFLDPFFTLPEKLTLRDLFFNGVAASDSSGQRKTPEAITSNFLGMVTYLAQCLAAKDADVCVWLDADISLYVNNSGLLDLAPNIFQASPELVILGPPMPCDERITASSCKIHRPDPHELFKGVSSRHMIMNRSRFIQLLPLPMSARNINLLGLMGRYFEAYFDLALPAGKFAQMKCALETYVVHSKTPDMDTAENVRRVEDGFVNLTHASTVGAHTTGPYGTVCSHAKFLDINLTVASFG